MKITFFIKHQGFSLLEILISMLIGLFILALVYKIYESQTLVHRQILANQQIQENFLITQNILESDLRNAGTLGCQNLFKTHQAIIFKNQTLFDGEHAIKIYSSHRDEDEFNLPPTDPKKGDILLIEFADQPISFVKLNSKQIKISKNSSYQKNDLIITSNCHDYNKNKIISIKSDQNQDIITLENSLKQTKDDFNIIEKPHAYLYYISETARKNSSKSETSALYRKDLLAPSQLQNEITENIERMNFHFLDAPSDLIEINLLLSSQDEVYQKPQRLLIQHEEILMNDRRDYHNFHWFIALRNMKLAETI